MYNYILNFPLRVLLAASRIESQFSGFVWYNSLHNELGTNAPRNPYTETIAVLSSSKQFDTSRKSLSLSGQVVAGKSARS